MDLIAKRKTIYMSERERAEHRELDLSKRLFQIALKQQSIRRELGLDNDGFIALDEKERDR